jgi:hypothetical protein
MCFFLNFLKRKIILHYIWLFEPFLNFGDIQHFCPEKVRAFNLVYFWTILPKAGAFLKSMCYLALFAARDTTSRFSQKHELFLLFFSCEKLIPWKHTGSGHSTKPLSQLHYTSSWDLWTSWYSKCIT